MKLKIGKHEAIQLRACVAHTTLTQKQRNILLFWNMQNCLVPNTALINNVFNDYQESE